MQVCIMQEFDGLKNKLDDGRKGRNEADDQEDQLKAALRTAHQSIASQVCRTPAVLAFSLWGCLSLCCTDCTFQPHLPDDD